MSNANTACDANAAPSTVSADDPYLSVDEVKKRYPKLAISNSNVRRLVKEGKFPPPTYLSARRKCWKLSTINGYIAERDRARGW